MKQIISLFLLLFIAACVPTEPPEETEPTSSATPSAELSATPMMTPSITAVSTATAVPAPTLTPITAQTAVFGTMSAEVEGWYIYHNKAHDYRFSYGPIAAPTLYSEDCVRVELYDSGYLLITSPAVSALPTACQPPSFIADPEPEMIRLAGQTVMAQKQTGLTYRVTLPNGLQIDYGLLPDVDPEAIDSQAALAVIGDMLDSLRFTEEVALVVVTPTPIAAGCLDETLPTNQPPAGNLRVVYEQDDQTWEWREETETTVSITPTPTSPLTEEEGLLSANGRFRIVLRQPDERRYELWLSDGDGSNPRLLLPISADELYERYPQVTDAQLAFEWVADTNLISYHFLPEANGLGKFMVQTMGIVDAESGDTWTVLPPDLAWTVQFNENGRSLIALTAASIQIINTLDGTVRLDIPLDVAAVWEQSITYTPDGQHIFIYTADGIALVNPDNGAITEIPLDYTPIGMGHYSILPPIRWLENETQFYTVTASDDIWANDAVFTVWLVDTATASTAPLNTFTGNYVSVELSPDQRWVSFWTQNMSNVRKLYLADVHSGEQFLYDELHVLEFISWSPDSSQFLYRSFDDNQLILGHICAPPERLDGIEVGLANNVKWVDDQRLLLLEGVPESSQPRPLHLVTLDGQSTLIATLSGEYPTFRFYFEE